MFSSVPLRAWLSHAAHNSSDPPTEHNTRYPHDGGGRHVETPKVIDKSRKHNDPNHALAIFVAHGRWIL